MRERYYPTHTQINITLEEKIGTLLNYITLQQHEFKGPTHYNSQNLLLHTLVCFRPNRLLTCSGQVCH